MMKVLVNNIINIKAVAVKYSHDWLCPEWWIVEKKKDILHLAAALVQTN